MIREIKLVEEFYRKFQDGDRIRRDFEFLQMDRLSQRKRLLLEEIEEMCQSNLTDQFDGDPTGVADGLGDQLYILFGTIIEYGLQDKMEFIFREIHRSNMTKLCSDDREAQQTILHYAKQGIEAYPTKINDDLILVRRSSDNKILKSINYEKADLAQFFQKDFKINMMKRYKPNTKDNDWVDLFDCSDDYVEVQGKQVGSNSILLKVTNHHNSNTHFSNVSGKLELDPESLKWKIKTK